MHMDFFFNVIRYKIQNWLKFCDLKFEFLFHQI